MTIIATVVFLACASRLEAKPKGLAVMAGKYTGVCLISQGEDIQIAGSVSFVISASKSGRNGRVTILRRRNRANYPAQVFKLRRGKVSLNRLLPGVQGDFGAKAAGEYKVKRAKVSGQVVTLDVNPLAMNFELVGERGKSMIRVSCVVKVPGGDDVFYTVIGS